MKERIGVHFGISFIYVVIMRNFLGDGYFYSRDMTSFQKSLIYCLLLAVSLTILLETWNCFTEIMITKMNLKKIMPFALFIGLSLIFLLHSVYYSLIICFLLFHICYDCCHIKSINKKTYQQNKNIICKDE